MGTDTPHHRYSSHVSVSLGLQSEDKSSKTGGGGRIQEDGGHATCMLKTSSELSDWPVMLLTSLEAWEDSEDEE